MRLRIAIATLFVFALANYVQASDFYVNMTEVSSTNLQVSVSFPGYSFNGTIASPITGGDSWTILQDQTYHYDGAPVASSWHDGAGALHAVGAIAWLEPDSNPATPTYNLMTFGYVPSGGEGEIIYAHSDLSVADLANNYNFYAGCYFGTGVAEACPILGNGQTYTLPLYTILNSSILLGNMDVTFNDRGDVTTPEPGTALLFGTLLLVGLAQGALGFFRPGKAL